MSNSDITVRCANALGTLIKETKSKAIVMNRWILALGLAQSAPELFSPTENEWDAENAPATGWHHGYMIGHDAPWTRTALGVSKFQDDIRLKLWAFYGFRDISVLNTHNSEHVFVQHIIDVSDAISASTKFETSNTPNGVQEIKGHDHWQIDDFGTYNFGKHRLHVAQGSIVIHLNRLIVPVSITG